MRIVLLVQMAVSRTKLVVTEIVEVKSISHLKKTGATLGRLGDAFVVPEPNAAVVFLS
jgi:hypothetical protein